MPELPDVEVFRRYLNATALHQRIARVQAGSPSLLTGTSPQGLGRALKHASFQATGRHGKYLFIAVTERKWLVMHFGMTGSLQYFRDIHDTPPHTRLLFTFENGYHLAYVAVRKLGRVALAGSPASWIDARGLGPDALGLGEARFNALAGGRRGGIKSWLMDQHSIAGLGNVYSDEILFRAGIHPGRPVGRLAGPDRKRVYRALRHVLQAAIRAGAEPARMPATFLLPHRHPGGHCPKCGSVLVKTRVAGRTTWFCPVCQAD